MTLNDLNIGEKAVIVKVKGRGAFRKRITEMGFIIGKEITVVRKAPLKDPIAYSVMGYEVSLRSAEAKMIDVVTEADVHEHIEGEFKGVVTDSMLQQTAHKKGKEINVAFVGNPNSGKTTIFNHASHSRERVGNYSGVTIAAKEAHFKLDDYRFNIVDLPGTYSLTAYSPEEVYVRDHIKNAVPDVVVNVIDASNIERNLYLTTQLIDMDIKVVVALNMYDEMKKNRDSLDYKMLGKLLGVPFVPTVGAKGKGVEDLFRRIIEVHEGRDEDVRHIHINFGYSVEESIKRLQETILENESNFITNKIAPRFIAIKLLENDAELINMISLLPEGNKILEHAEEERIQLEKDVNEVPESFITDGRYGFIQGALHETLQTAPKRRKRKSSVIDSIITHRFWGIPIFIFFMWFIFFFTFKVGQFPMQLIENGVGFISNWLHSVMPPGMLKDLFVDGIIGGVGGVIVFLPNILILYLFISIMEDSGYMARAVFIMDKAMHKIGLHGKSFIPLLMGFGCNVPAILSTRIIESKRDRLITILINPFMSCSARLPVYVLLISAFFQTNQGSILFLIYAIGVIIAILTALLLQKTFFKKADIPFVMELPPYRMPTVRTLLRHMWHRTEQYLKKITGVILIASVIIWALGYFPKDKDYSKDFDSQIAAIENKKAETIQTEQIAQLDKELNAVLAEKKVEDQEKSYIGQLGKAIQPVMKPLGFDWKMSVALLTGITAKEVIVGTMGVLYQSEPGQEEVSHSLVQKLQNSKITSGPDKGKKSFTPLIAFAFMIFILIYFPCVGVVAAIRKETHSWKWPIFSIFYTTGVAWLMSFLVFTIGKLLGF